MNKEVAPRYNTKEVTPQTAQQEIVKMLEQAESRGQSNVFQDWVSIMLCALNTPPREEEYMKRIQPYIKPDYSGKRTIDGFANGLAWLMMATKHTQHDVLGTVYEEFAVASKSRRQALGQFFTPVPICEMMTAMIGGNGSKVESVCDPCVGSGRMLISASKRVHQDSYFVGVDIDPVCADMTALNMLFFNVNGLCLWGDTLRMEYWGGYATRRTPFGGVIRTLTEEEAKQAGGEVSVRLENTKQTKQSPLIQLSMFGEGGEK